jgi:hypothetical protein
MSAPNPNWTRWVLGSIINHFDSNKGQNHLYVEGLKRTTNTQSKWAELRLDGPNVLQTSKGVWELYCEVNVLISCQANELNMYDYSTLSGYMQSLFQDSISVLKYGNQAGDDMSYVGCLQLQYNKGDKLQVSHFGIVEPKTNLQQGTVEGHYEMSLIY